MKHWVCMMMVFAAACAPSATLTESQEYYAGRAAAADVLNRYDVYQDETLIEYLADMGYLLARSSERQNTFKGYHFAVLDIDEVNAYTAPSGFIFITRGLIALCENEDELAGVVSHELGHSAKRHPELEARAAMNASRWGEAAGFLTSLAAQVAETKEQVKALNLLDDVVKGLSKAWADGYGSDQELEADREAAKIMAKAGYDPRALVTMLGRLTHKDGKGWNSNKYPSVRERIDAVEKAIREGSLEGAAASPARTERFKKITARIKGGRP